MDAGIFGHGHCFIGKVENFNMRMLCRMLGSFRVSTETFGEDGHQKIFLKWILISNLQNNRLI